MKKLTLLILLGLVLLSTGCASWFKPIASPSVTPSITPRATATWTPVPLPPAGVQTPAPGRVAITLATVKDSPSLVWFEVYNAAGEKLWQGGERTNILYLAPGEYRYNAMAPIPTQPLGCYNVEQDYGYYIQNNFTVGSQPVVIEVKLGMIISFCTPTPTP